jgi:superfamily II DNA or RNA helicase
MRASITNNQFVYIDNISTTEEDVLFEQMSATSPNIYVDTTETMWDGVYRKYNRAKQRIRRPLLQMLKDVCEKHDFPLQIEDTRPDWDYPITPRDEIRREDFLPGITMDVHQWASAQKVARAHYDNECGIISVPTGGGKGEIICAFCKIFNCPTVILADQTVVVSQLKERLEMRLLEEEIGMFFAGRRPNGETIVVGTVQSLSPPTKPPVKPIREELDKKLKKPMTDAAWKKRLTKYEDSIRGFKTRRKNAKALLKYVKDAEMILVDECDKATSDPYKKIFKFHFKGRRRYGFSGTPFDPEKPVEGLVMQEHLGPVIVQVSRRHLEEIGRIIRCEYVMMGFGLEGSIKESSAYDIAREDWMFSNARLHRLIAGICKKHKGDGNLVLVDSVKLGEHLVESCENLGLTAHFIYGKTPKRRRDEILRSFERREFDVLIGGKIINRGLDLDGGCENLIIATGGKLQSDFLQKIGRALRHNRDGISRVYDIFFRCNKHLYKHSRARLQIMVRAEYDTRVVFPGGSIDGAQLIQKRWRIPKGLLKRSSQKRLFDKGEAKA